MKSLVFDIKHFSTHDGPGIRTTVFLKGCSLSCKWCQNPEGISPQKELWYFENKCIRCYECIQVCPEKALTTSKSGGIILNKDACSLCGNCVDICPKEALAFIGKEMTPEEVFEDVCKDKVFYDVSNGGVTLSGGDPLVNIDFSCKVLKLCKKDNIHTAIETCLDKKTEVISKIAEVTDLIIADFKLFNNDMHRKYCGKSNERIKTNIRFLIQSHFNILIRIPLIPGITATEENLKSIAQFLVNENPNVPVELINFNPLANAKYQRMDKQYIISDKSAKFSGEEMEQFHQILRKEGLHCVITNKKDVKSESDK